MTIRVKHELKRKYVTLSCLVITHVPHPHLGCCPATSSLSSCLTGSERITPTPADQLALQEEGAWCPVFSSMRQVHKNRVTLIDFFCSEITEQLKYTHTFIPACLESLHCYGICKSWSLSAQQTNTGSGAKVSLHYYLLFQHQHSIHCCLKNRELDE